MKAKPNILVVLCDQLRAISAPPFERQVDLPAMSSMIEDGISLTNALSTCPLCTPYRGMFMTGRYPQTTGVIVNFTSTRYDEIGLGDVFANAGYRTGYIGKWHLNRGSFPSESEDFIPKGRARLGFDFWRTYNCHVDFWDGHINGEDYDTVQWKGYETEAMVDYVKEFIEDECPDPWFLVLSPHQPHWNWAPTSAPQECYDALPEKLKLPPDVPDDYRKEAEEAYRHYMAMTLAVDRLLAEARSLAGPDTLVIFTSDHGTQMGARNLPGERNAWGKCRPQEESIRVPFFACWDGRIDPGSTSDTLFTPVDVLPTLCGLAGIPVPQSVEGIDLSDHLLRRQPAQERDAALIMSFLNYRESPNLIRSDGKEWRGVRTKKYTYVEWREGEVMLFDLEADPAQLTNLAGDPRYAETQNELAARLKEMLAARGDIFPPYTHYRTWIDEQRRIIRNGYGPLPHPETLPDWSLLTPSD